MIKTPFLLFSLDKHTPLLRQAVVLEGADSELLTLRILRAEIDLDAVDQVVHALGVPETPHLPLCGSQQNLPIYLTAISCLF